MFSYRELQDNIVFVPEVLHVRPRVKNDASTQVGRH